MSRPAEEILEFDKLREVLRLRSTCAPGRRALEAREFLEVASLLETAPWLRQQFREDDDKFPLLAARAESVIDFRDVLGLIRRAILPSGEISDDASPELRKIRASILQTRDSIQKSLK